MRMRAASLTLIVVLALAGCRSSTDELTVAPVAESPAVTTNPEGLVLDAEVTTAEVALAPRSEDQERVREQFGAPDRFVLLFTDGGRQETWQYDTAGYEIAFRDGVLLYVDPVPTVSIEGLGTTPFEPDRFTGGMSLPEFLAVAGQRDYAEQPLDAADGQLVVVRGIVAGFDDAGLRYLETIPIDLR